MVAETEKNHYATKLTATVISPIQSAVVKVTREPRLISGVSAPVKTRIFNSSSDQTVGNGFKDRLGPVPGV